MAHYAFLDENNIVTEVITGVSETELIDGKTPEIWYGEFREQKCVRTSYNTYGGQHSLGGTPFRKNYAGIGFIYDKKRDAFIPPKPYNSWLLNDSTCLWEPVSLYPEDGKDYVWDESTVSWKEVTNG